MTTEDKPASFAYLEVGFAIFLCIALVRLLWNAFVDLRFYWSSGWDFSKPSGRNLHYGFAGAATGPMPNKLRLLVGYPFMIAVISVALLFMVRGWT
ncbi:hypothetical protein [Taklimakanibacter lacteus]|uniref:hypothetical protein n=1 Tax=Taklimakanibacter lacteus TaxID=2268456 RepID=UPI000E668AB5